MDPYEFKGEELTGLEDGGEFDIPGEEAGVVGRDTVVPVVPREIARWRVGVELDVGIVTG